MSKINDIISVIHYTICGAVCFQFTHSLYDGWENIYTLSYNHHLIGSMNYYPLFRVRPWNNGMHCMSFFILMSRYQEDAIKIMQLYAIADLFPKTSVYVTDMIYIAACPTRWYSLCENIIHIKGGYEINQIILRSIQWALMQEFRSFTSN